MNLLHEWARLHGVSDAAIAQLRAMLTVPVGTSAPGLDEASVQAAIRVAASQKGMLLFRNNVGVLKDERGVPVRYGLANDSAAMNKACKSSDLVGILPVTITPAMVGSVVGQFCAIECKREGWKYSGSEREAAQLKWLTIIQANGGRAVFATGAEGI